MIPLVMLCMLTGAPQETHPLTKDRTGLEWVLPFKEARKAASERNRLLLIKPVAFGTSSDGGW